MKNMMHEISAHAYHLLDRLSSSGMTHFEKSPRYYRAMRDAPKPASDSQNEGTMVHECLLEPKKFAAKYLPVDIERKGTKEWKYLCESNPSKIIIKREDYEKITEAAHAVRSNDSCRRIFEESLPERTILWDEAGVPAKARLDLVRPFSHIVDVKTSRDCDKFSNSAFGYRYHRQAAWYQRAAIAAGIADENTPFYFLVCETEFPFEVRIYQPVRETFELANREIDDILSEFSVCLKENKWPDKTGPFMLTPPRWMTFNE